MAHFTLFLRSCLRNVLRQRRRTVIALSAIAFGVVALLVILLPWMLRSLIEFTRAVIERIPSMVN